VEVSRQDNQLDSVTLLKKWDKRGQVMDPQEQHAQSLGEEESHL
jgi:hypothetical protein